MNEPTSTFVAYPRDYRLSTEGAKERLLALADGFEGIGFLYVLNASELLTLFIAVGIKSLFLFTLYLILIAFSCLMSFRTSRRIVLGMDTPGSYAGYCLVLIGSLLVPVLGIFGLINTSILLIREIKRYGVRHRSQRSYRNDILDALAKQSKLTAEQSWLEPPTWPCQWFQKCKSGLSLLGEVQSSNR